MSVDKRTGVVQQDIDNVNSMYEQFLLLKSENMPWNNIKLLQIWTLDTIETFNDLLLFYKTQNDFSASYKNKIDRMICRYFAGAKGTRKLKAYNEKQFVKDFLDCPHPAQAKTDRDTVIKLMNAAYEYAFASDQVANRDFPNLVKNQKRNRTDKSQKPLPKLTTYVGILSEGLTLVYHEMVLNMIMQEDFLTRKSVTASQEVSKFDLDASSCEVYAQESKSGDHKKHLASDPCVLLLRTYIKHLKADTSVSKDKSGNPKYLFESPSKPGQPRCNFDNQFKHAKASYLEQVNQNYIDDDKEKVLNEIRNFTQHRIRDLSDSLMLNIGATEAQKELAACRSINDVAAAYEALDCESIIELKNKKHRLIVENEPDYGIIYKTLKSVWSINAQQTAFGSELSC